jgi:hypothetical protein
MSWSRPCISQIAGFTVDHIELPGYCVGLLDDKCSKIASSYVHDKLIEAYKKLHANLDELMISIEPAPFGIIVYSTDKTYFEIYVYNKPRLEVYVVEIKCKEFCEMPIQLIKEV